MQNGDNKQIDMGRRSSSSSASLEQFRRRIPLVDLELENITYAPMTRGMRRPTQKVILRNVSTRIEPYTLSAWMGPSGSGKSTLMSIAAGLVRPSDLEEGSIVRSNGEEGAVLPKRLVGVVWQDDLMLSNLSVEETIYFSARLKTPKSVPHDEVQLVVEEAMAELGLLRVRDSLIGRVGEGGGGGGRNGSTRSRGISGGERKRVAVASELVGRPALLFLDEPTSGLDSTTAQALMVTLKELASLGHSVAVVIHQPRTAIFNLLDNLVLLSRGQMVYNGKACNARAYLEQLPLVKALPPETAIADWIMDSITEDEKRGDQSQLAEFWARRSKSHPSIPSSGQRQGMRRRSTVQELRAVSKFETPFWLQLKMLIERTMKQEGSEMLGTATALKALGYIVFTGAFWWRLPDDTGRIYDRNSLFLQMLLSQTSGVVIASINVFQRDRGLLQRERAKKLYGVLPYFLAKTLSDLTNNVLLACVYGAVVYWMTNLRPSVVHYFRFLFSFYMVVSTAQSLGLFISIALPTVQIALILGPPLTMCALFLCGFYAPFDTMPSVLEWASWTSFARYGYSSMLINEYQGRDIPCSDDNVPIAIAADENECPRSGDDVVASYGIDGIFINFWFNVGVLFLLQTVFRVSSYFLLVKTKKTRF